MPPGGVGLCDPFRVASYVARFPGALPPASLFCPCGADGGRFSWLLYFALAGQGFATGEGVSVYDEGYWWL